MNLWILIILTVSCFCTSALAQRCVDSIVPTTNVEDYQINSNGTVIDIRNQLMWKRCALGQAWENKSCVGEAINVDWQQANVLANDDNSHTLWRLPTVHELSKLAELSCENPAINLRLFPNAPSLHFWTSIEFVNDHNYAWQVFFGTGENHTAKKSTPSAVLLVRSLNNKKN